MNKKCVLMVGPDDSVMGGMTSVQQIYHQHWDYESLSLRYVGIYSAGSKNSETDCRRQWLNAI